MSWQWGRVSRIGTLTPANDAERPGSTYQPYLWHQLECKSLCATTAFACQALTDLPTLLLPAMASAEGSEPVSTPLSFPMEHECRHVPAASPAQPWHHLDSALHIQQHFLPERGHQVAALEHVWQCAVLKLLAEQHDLLKAACTATIHLQDSSAGQGWG